MYTRYYDSYPANVPHSSDCEANNEAGKCTREINEESSSISANETHTEIASILPGGLFGNMKSDDILLIALLFIVASESKDDFIMPLILGALLLG